MLACKNLPRSKSAVHALLKLKANTNLVTNESCSALQWAAVHGDVEVILKALAKVMFIGYFKSGCQMACEDWCKGKPQQCVG